VVLLSVLHQVLPLVGRRVVRRRLAAWPCWHVPWRPVPLCVVARRAQPWAHLQGWGRGPGPGGSRGLGLAGARGGLPARGGRAAAQRPAYGHRGVDVRRRAIGGVRHVRLLLMAEQRGVRALVLWPGRRPAVGRVGLGLEVMEVVRVWM
jgi:hypothetical protein